MVKRHYQHNINRLNSLLYWIRLVHIEKLACLNTKNHYAYAWFSLFLAPFHIHFFF